MTTDFNDALSYTDSPSKVISKKIKLKDLISEYPDEIDVSNPKNPISYELIYDPKHDKVKITSSKISEIWNESKVLKPAIKK